MNSRTFVTTSLVFSLFAAPAVYPAPEQSYPRQETGIASYYSSAFNGRRTASGERFSNTARSRRRTSITCSGPVCG